MSNYDAMRALILSFPGEHKALGVPMELCRFMGSLEGGVFLSQLIFWSDKSKRKDGWFYKKHEEWQTETMLSQYKVNKYTEQLVNLGVLEFKLKKANGSPTCHYKFDYEKFHNLFIEFLTMDSLKTSQSITENSTMDSLKTSQSITDTVTETVTETTTQPPSANAEGARAFAEASETETETVTLPGKIPSQQFNDWGPNPIVNAWFKDHQDADRGQILKILRWYCSYIGGEPYWQDSSNVISWLNGAQTLNHLAYSDFDFLKEIVEMTWIDIQEPRNNMLEIVQDALEEKRVAERKRHIQRQAETFQKSNEW